MMSSRKSRNALYQFESVLFRLIVTGDLRTKKLDRALEIGKRIPVRANHPKAHGIPVLLAQLSLSSTQKIEAASTQGAHIPTPL